MRRAADLFPACEFTESTLQEWIESPDHLNWTSFTKDWKYFELLARTKTLERQLSQQDSQSVTPSFDASPSPRQSRRYQYDFDQHNPDERDSRNLTS